MLDIALFRDAPDRIRADHDRRGLSHDAIDQVIELDQTWRNLLHETDQLRRSKNEAARGIGAAKKSSSTPFPPVPSYLRSIAPPPERKS